MNQRLAVNMLCRLETPLWRLPSPTKGVLARLETAFGVPNLLFFGVLTRHAIWSPVLP